MKFKKLLDRSKSDPEPPQIVTNATLDEYRKKIFARGRRFVYPVYVAKHRIVFLSLFLVIVLTVVLMLSSMLAIYRYRVESDLMYRISRIVPFPAVKVDGSYGSYREYLLILRSNQAFLTQKDEAEPTQSLDAQKQEELRTQAVQELKRRVKLKRIADEKAITVTPQEIDEQLMVLEAASGSQSRFEDIVSEYYGLSASELREQVRIQLLKQKVRQFLDTESASQASEVLAKLQAGTAFETVAKEYADTEEDPLSADEQGATSIVLEDKESYPQALTEAIQGLAEGGLSGVINSPAGIHIVRRGTTDGPETKISHIFISYQDTNKLLDDQLTSSSHQSYLK